MRNLGLLMASMLAISSSRAKKKKMSGLFVDQTIRVDPGIYRGARFETELDLILTNSERKFKTILNLEVRDSFFETRWAFYQKVTLINVDLNPFFISPWDVRFLVDVISDERNHPIYVHCRHGRERTGLVVAAYRCRKGWKVENAYDEMVSRGCRLPFRWFYRRLLQHFSERLM